ncbi:SGNH/GDSL hydrolase family protein [Actinomadura barringtoniae]|uniref:SGNH/GDSL hydrolase family protein n=1 Tax=Actinomadura barringtoniae TaxID=1427535 RepID=UPI0027DDDD17|nr:SGNH/GDSL hydrolase family protein [Actinomadura barringtoniae]
MPRRSLATAALATLSSALLATPAHADTVNYVALGDSYTSAPLISPNQQNSPLGCFRADRDYPAQVAAAIHPTSFKDVSCGGASTKHMTETQNLSFSAPNPPQFDALTPDTTLVTLTIGGNDIGFGGIGTKCVTLAFGASDASPCKDNYVVDGVDQLAQKIDAAAPKVADVLKGIHAKSPNAHVLLLNYPLITPATGTGCFPTLPIAKGDVPYLRDVQHHLNQMLADQASANASTLVDTTEAGHDICQQDPAKRWIEGLPTQWAAPAHPNLNGATAMAQATLKAIQAQ